VAKATIRSQWRIQLGRFAFRDFWYDVVTDFNVRNPLEYIDLSAVDTIPDSRRFGLMIISAKSGGDARLIDAGHENALQRF
jgi:hypothetical protein